MGVDGAKCKMLVERVLKETFPKAMAYNKQTVLSAPLPSGRH
jgi:hypothetical protein